MNKLFRFYYFLTLSICPAKNIILYLAWKFSNKCRVFVCALCCSSFGCAVSADVENRSLLESLRGNGWKLLSHGHLWIAILQRYQSTLRARAPLISNRKLTRLWAQLASRKPISGRYRPDNDRRWCCAFYRTFSPCPVLKKWFLQLFTSHANYNRQPFLFRRAPRNIIRIANAMQLQKRY